MKILFLHGWTSIPGGVKPTFLADQWHTVINPALDDDDFEAAVRTAQAEYDQHQPDVVVGSSRGGAVAMNIESGNTPLVLLCPAWKNWGTAKTVKPNTTILHSKADDVIPFTDSEELVRNSGLPESALIEIGNDHRLADAGPLEAMLEACEQAFTERIRSHATWLRKAIDRAQAEHPNKNELIFIEHWPSNCCDTPYLFLLLYELGYRGITIKRADVSHYGQDFNKHVWFVLDGVTIDITADQFPGIKDKVIVSRHSEWHDSLNVLAEEPFDEDDKYNFLVEQECYHVYEKILPIYAP